MSLYTSQHLWLEPQGDKILVQNVCSGRRVVLDREQLGVLDQPTSDSPLLQRLIDADIVVDERPDRGLQNSRAEAIVRAVDRYLANQMSMSSKKLQRTHPLLLERLDLARERALSQARGDEQQRDLKALFGGVKHFLESDGELDTFTYKGGFLSASAGRPLPRDEFAQLPCMPETTQRRVELARSGLGPDSRALVLGDDDLIGLYWSLNFEQPCQVFEIDEALLNYLRPLLRPHVSLHVRDLTEGLPGEFHGLYDVIFSDPMYTREGWDLFLKCCRQGLSDSSHSRVYLTTSPNLIEDGHLLEERLDAVGLRLVMRHPNFSRYNMPASTRRRILHLLRGCGVSEQLLQGLLQIPYLYTEMLELSHTNP